MFRFFLKFFSPTLFLYKPVDCSDICYVNYTHSPVDSPLKNIEYRAIQQERVL